MILLEALWPPRTVLAILQTFMRNQGDAWTSTLGALKRILETAALTPHRT
jgi:maltose alpha-D-glucosyltransferase/alpha-amylase